MKSRFLSISLALCLLSASAVQGQTSGAASSASAAAPNAQPAKTAPASPAAGTTKPPAQPAKNASTGATAPGTKGKTGAPAEPQAAPGSASLPDAYRNITLGMDIEAVKTELLADSIFGYRGERDVSLLPTQNRSLIETVGSSYIRRSWLQFHEDKLYTMTFALDTAKVDYYSMYSAFVSKYGEPVTLDPKKAVWDDGHVTLSLERPLTVKYIDVEVFKKLLEESGSEKAASDISRESFINEF